MNLKIKVFVLLSFFSVHSSWSNESVLKVLENEARDSLPNFSQFSSAAGEKFYKKERVHSNGEKISCTTCHTSNPKMVGLTRANKVIQPMAVSINAERFTDIVKVQKWFKRNCNDVLERVCTAQEKGDFAKYMMSIK
jgi:hypothetical protein